MIANYYIALTMNVNKIKANEITSHNNGPRTVIYLYKSAARKKDKKANPSVITLFQGLKVKLIIV